MHKKGKDHILIPALVAAAAAYFGLKKKSENISEIAKDLVSRAIKDQTRTNHRVNKHNARRRNKRNYRDTYYG